MIQSRFLNPKFWLASVTAFGVGLLIAEDLRPRAPGPLVSAHESHPDLDSRGSCATCHGDGETTLTDSCLECHDVIGAHIEGRLGLHGMLDETVSAQCALCHSEHHGEDFRIVNERSFFIAGIEDVANFDHTLVGFAMEGRHTELECTECHTKAEAVALEAGEYRYVGLRSDCASCHEDPHEGGMGRSCTNCHGQDGFAELTPFEHDRRFELEGAHAGARCYDCHEPGSRWSVEAETRAEESFSVRQCVQCHETPHSREFGSGVAQLLGVLPGESCIECHAPTSLDFAARTRELTAAEHATAGFRLETPHGELACAQCHSEVVEGFEAAHPGRAADDCAACHGDPHEGQFTSDPVASGRFAGGCLDCHGRHTFEPHTFDLRSHARTGLPLDGAHLDLECEACHVQPDGAGARRFAGTDTQCAGCHDDVHAGFFATAAKPARREQAGDCASCHRTTGFDASDRQEFEHGEWTGFALAGAHLQSDCESCHRPSDESRGLGRRLGFVRERFGDPSRCSGCHEDPHRGRFDRVGQPLAVEGRRDCARCHVETSFRVFEDGFDHSLWTGFRLEGAHRRLSCSTCHAPLKKASPDGRTWESAKGTACVDCHQDPHLGQFEEQGRSDCSTCHTPRKEFPAISFDHDEDTDFALDQAHAELECSACHKREDIGGGRAVRYRPLGSECVDCHGVTKSRLRPKQRKGGR